MSATERPNILLIVSDDHGYADRSARGSADAHTPNLDRLAAQGMVMDQGYVTAPICSPSRAGLISGAHQQRWGAQWFDSSAFPPAGRRVMPEVLRDAGYRTGYFGKLHYGPERPGDRACPENHGFDQSLYALAGMSMGRLHYLHHSDSAVQEYGDAAPVHGVSPLLDGGVPVDCERHLTVEFTDRALAFMGEGEDRADPFFCMVAYNAVHNFAWQLPADELDARALPRHDDFDPDTSAYVDWYDGAISPRLEHGRAYYLAQLEIMDREIGRMLDHLESTGRRESTLVVYLTDNGGSRCNYGDNHPLDGSKYTLLEGGVRVPMILSWPGTIPVGRSRALISAMDLLPTFAAAAGAGPGSAEPTDGQDLRPVWEGRARGHDALHFDTGFQWAVRTPQWKLRWVDATSGHREHLAAVEHTDIGEGLTLVPMGAEPVPGSESAAADVSADHPDVVAELLGLHEEWKGRTVPVRS
jgi:arylsulfatase A-like enzyme